MKKCLSDFLDNIVTRKIDNEKDAKEKYLETVFNYKEALKRQKIHEGRNSKNVKIH